MCLFFDTLVLQSKKGHQPFEVVTLTQSRNDVDTRNGNIINQKCFNCIDEPKYMADDWLGLWDTRNLGRGIPV